jgi:tRNA pseudouridine55 synthase
MTIFKASTEDFIQGTLILFDKPIDWTSFDIVKKVKALLRHSLGIKKIKVGHAGTLDPLASGLLVICTGKMTKEIESFQNLEKEYTGTFHIGTTTPSADLETLPNGYYPTEHINEELIDRARRSFLGEIQQIPPLFSAKKINGERAYEHARRGENTIMQANTVHIHEFEIVRVELPEIGFRVVCSKGTYIRALARDFGEALNSGAYLKELRRTRIGHLMVDDAWHPEDFAVFVKAQRGKDQT